MNSCLLEKLRNAYIKNIENSKVKKTGPIRGKISSTKNKFEMSAESKAEQDDWEIVEKAGKLAGLTRNMNDEDSEY